MLAIECQKDESRYYATTEISHLINRYFKEYKKNKKNVSRYYNQSFYVYYEVKYENRKNRYKLSPIGYSEALRVYRYQVLNKKKRASGDGLIGKKMKYGGSEIRNNG